MAVVVELVALTMVSAQPAVAHLAIRLDIRAPQPGQHVGHDLDAVIFAQQTLAGVDQTTYSAALDGHAIDPATGHRVAQAQAVVIKVGTMARIPLRGLTNGSHQLAVAYRPDTDMPIIETSVHFTVDRPGTGTLLLVGVGVSIAVAATAVVVVARRRRPVRR